MDKKKFYEIIASWAVLLFLWNPITLWLLIGKFVPSLLIVIAVLIVYLAVCYINKERLKIWCFNLLMIGSVFYHAELIFRTIYIDRDIPNLYEIREGYYFNKPFLNQVFDTNEYCSLYRTNSQGYRIDNETNQYESVDKCDWLFIGDSFTQGAQVDYPQLFSSLIYRDFSDKIIVNAGISGAGICDELNYLKDEGIKLCPKVVFLQLGVFNDFYNVYERHATWKDYLIDYSSLYRYIEYNLSATDELPLGRWVEPFSPTEQGNKDYNILYKPSSAVKERDLRAFETYLDKFNQLVKENGAELVVLLIPSKEQVSDALLSEVVNAYNIDMANLDMRYPSILMEQLSNTYGFKLIDLYDDFRSSSMFPFFDIDEHMNVYGHEIIANRIRAEFSNILCPYSCLSSSNTNDRYPTLYNNDGYILYQNYSNGKHHIVLNNSSFSDYQEIVSSKQELIHPTISANNEILLFTEGNQDNGQTEIVTINLRNGVKRIVTSDSDSFGAIPQFNSKGDKIVYAGWRSDSRGQMSTPTISIYDMTIGATEDLQLGSEECWRPVFWNNDSCILFIQKDVSTEKFVVRSYSLLDHNVTTILTCDYDIWDIAISPSNKYIAFAGNESGNWDLFLYDIKQKTISQITSSQGNEWDPAFGNNDREIWFAGTSGINNGIFYLTLDDAIIDHN